MSKNAKRIIIAVIILLLVLAIIWVVYESFKAEPANINATNELPNENTGIDNVTDVFKETNSVNETNEVDANVVEDDTEHEQGSSEVTTNDSNDDDNDNNGNSEKVYGTVEEREARAVELAKEYYEEEYGNSSELIFAFESLNGDGRYIVRAGKPGVIDNKFFFVDVDSGIVQER